MDDNTNTTLNRALKFTIITITALIAASVILIIVALFNKKSATSPTSLNIQQITAIEASFPANCNPITTNLEPGYIALVSKKCNTLKIIDLNNQKNYTIQF